MAKKTIPERPLTIPAGSFRARIRAAIEGITRQAERIRLTAVNLDDAAGELPASSPALELRQAVVAVESCALHAILDAATIIKHAGAIEAYSELRDLDEGPAKPRRRR